MLEDQLRDRESMAGELLQYIDRRRVRFRSLRFLDHRIIQFLEENMRELLWRVDIELRPRLRKNLSLELHELRAHRVRHLLEKRNVDANSTLFHPLEDRDERHLDGLVNFHERRIAAQLRLEHFFERQGDVGFFAKVALVRTGGADFVIERK